MSKIKMFRRLVSKRNISLRDKLILSLIFGLYGIIGTYTGIPIDGAIANSRVVGVFTGGLLGGPIVGVLAGVIAGLHRYLIDLGGFTSFSCALSTIVEGVMAGFLSKRIERSDQKLLFVLLSGMMAEFMQMAIILLTAKPFYKALDLVKVIGIPMIIANAIGITVFIAITDSIFKDIETAAAYQAQVALRIANRTLKYFRKGFNEKTAYETAKIIKSMTDVKAVAFTDTEKILAHVGLGEEHHLVGNPVITALTKDVLKKGKYKIANTKEEINCENNNCKLESAIIVPLKEKNKIIGCLKLYKDGENSITKVDVELALGLALLFSTQIELSKLDYQSELLAKAELKALQAQINPHFLFNAINTIVSLIRTQPDNARRLLIHLGNYFRKNLQQNTEEVNIHKEIEHINSYVEIEKARFGDNLRIIYDIPEDVDCLLPPLLLQPIVENAIKHGVLEKIEGGTVEILAIDSDNETKIMVKDDGVGMSKELIESLLLGKIESDSIGLINVNNRLKNKYGEKYGLDIESEKDKGTTVTIRIPKKTKRGQRRNVA
ncbi:sensor histidine kinase [Tissierella sp. MSJ-40]|uniref:Sensor histidine kinase n=1 Tax=Tissierella simiarum TaxID=2841534 RepID=A0ABS6E3K9_9FIRM|nr:sensor histidine kinase [Tissierella simiarum]MBU5437411.1 sensor histidine kinase [Tissierella simiarum]